MAENIQVESMKRSLDPFRDQRTLDERRQRALDEVRKQDQAGPHKPPESVDHPSHYGGQINPYEAIKVIEAWDLNFSLGSCLKYICRAGLKGDRLEDLRKAAKYLEFEILRELAKREK